MNERPAVWTVLTSTLTYLIISQVCTFAFILKSDFSLSKTITSLSSSSLITPTSEYARSDGVAVIGCGVLGTRICRQLLESPRFSLKKITAMTKSNSRHASILAELSTQIPASFLNDRFRLCTSDEASASEETFRDVIFCAPPSGFEDYPSSVGAAIQTMWDSTLGGDFVFTSSGGIYGNGDAQIVDESSPTADAETNPRAAKLIRAEKKVLDEGGKVVRLAGLYSLDRGAHNYWYEVMLPKSNDGKLEGRPDGIVNLVHYDDAASSCLAALCCENKNQSIFLISDGNPTTRKGICESAKRAKRYKDCKMPVFVGGSNAPRGKVYDGRKSENVLNWKPMYESFDSFMRER